MSEVSIWMPIYIGDILSKITRLTTEQFGAASLLMMDYWKNGSIPNDDQTIANITRLSTRKAKQLKKALCDCGFFEIADKIITSLYLDELKKKATDNKSAASEKASNAAQVRWEKERKAKELAEQLALQEQQASNSNAMHEHMPKHAPSNAPDMPEQCPSTSTSSINNTHTQSADTRDQIDNSEDFNPVLEQVNTRLKRAGAKEINASVLQKLLQPFRDHYANHTRLQAYNWWLGEFVKWVRSDRLVPENPNNQKASQKPAYKPAGAVNQNWPGSDVTIPVQDFDQAAYQRSLDEAGLS